MSNPASKPDVLRTQIESLESHLLELKKQLADAVQIAEVSNAKLGTQPSNRSALGSPASDTYATSPWPLDAGEYTRYGRQMITPEVGLQGQLNLRSSSVLIIGVGGLGCPAAQYLAGAGIGTIGLVDGDVVEWSNLHRQILHTSERVGQLKVESAIISLSQLNHNVRYIAYPNHLTPATAVAMMEDYDLVLDCTDHPASRYLISDAAVLAGKPLISGSALRTEGQLMVLNNPPSTFYQDTGGPCYRCIFPKPPPVESVTSCGDGGILGPVVGVIGVLMALEAIKLVAPGEAKPNIQLGSSTRDTPASMLLFSGYSTTPFRQVRLRGKRLNCIGCSSSGTISKEALISGSLDYEVMCGTLSPINILHKDERVEAQELKNAIDTRKKPYIILDVRDKTQFDICNLPGSVNIPIASIEAITVPPVTGRNTGTDKDQLATSLECLHPDASIYTICRLGNDSQLAVRKLKSLGYDNNGKRWIGDVKGGYRAWKQQVDPNWPDY